MNVANRKTNRVEMVERTGAEIFRFARPGDCLRGRLIEIETADIGGKPTLRYVLRNEEERKTQSCLGTVDLMNKIRSSDLGKLLEICFVGTDTETSEGKNPIKRFKVLVENDK